ncbi:hypothetical protein AB1Y20_023059 [Prymnesium parvum]|uniref:Uncharacterized protein n=1 Tax=Prymnesium parvum TaxID=97485 RepID=A0AB34JCR8_PRYPA
MVWRFIPLMLLVSVSSSRAYVLALSVSRAHKTPNSLQGAADSNAPTRPADHSVDRLGRIVPVLNAASSTIESVKNEQDVLKSAVRQQLSLLKDRLSIMHAQNMELTTVLHQTSTALQETLGESSQLSEKVQELSRDLMERDATATSLGVKVNTLETTVQSQARQLLATTEQVTSQGRKLEAIIAEAAAAQNVLDIAISTLDQMKCEALEMFAEQDARISSAEAMTATAHQQLELLQRQARMKDVRIASMVSEASAADSSVDEVINSIEELRHDAVQIFNEKDNEVASAKALALEEARKAAQLESAMKAKDAELATVYTQAEVARSTARGTIEEMRNILDLITEMKTVLEY